MAHPRVDEATVLRSTLDTADEQYRTNRSDVELSLAYIITDKLIAGVGAAFRYTHDGFDLVDYPMLGPTDPLITWHDPVLRVRYFAPAVFAVPACGPRQLQAVCRRFQIS